jgi:S-methylmethionine-dependent homocysteine/selenocysteine methylase
VLVVTVDHMTITILDGGMGRELARMGAPFRQPEWSALALMEAPDTVVAAHRAFIAAGADVITTNSYALVPFHIGDERFAAHGRALAELAGRLARDEARAAERSVTVAGSLPPLFGSYRPDLFDPRGAPAVIDPLIDGLGPHVDLWLGETLGSIAEAVAVRAALDHAGDRRPVWLSFTLADEEAVVSTTSRLRSGESVADATVAAGELGAAAILFNCSQPEVISSAIEVAVTARGSMRVGGYGNAFGPQSADAEANEGLSDLRDDLGPVAYCSFATSWIERGATIVGGCCGIGPDHIAEIVASTYAR